MRLSLLIIFSLFIIHTQAQTKGYWITFEDKAATTFTIESPQAFIPETVIERRAHFNLPFDSKDLPVCAAYLLAIENINGEVKHTSRWLNSALVVSDNPLFSDLAAGLPIVASVIDLGETKQTGTEDTKLYVETTVINAESTTDNYGPGANQITMLEGEFLHNLMYRGEGIDIAIMDNGFTGVDTNIYYQNAINEGRLHGVFNFVDDTNFVFDNGSHGSFVLSTIAADSAGALIGTGPKANYFLYTTEDDAAEGLQEEINWALAAEMAESTLGIHTIITTSLGYSTGFDNPADEHSYSDMDGNTTIITRAADVAASKGLLVINSAGNEGAEDWHFITAPADGDSVLAIGAVNNVGVVTNFSSRGPSADGDIKPNVSAQGRDAVGITKDEELVLISGTSFSCPITSGMAACLWQAFPDYSNMEILRAIEKSAHLYNNPDDDYGYGIPNFRIAFELLTNAISINEGALFTVYPNPSADVLNFMFLSQTPASYNWSVHDYAGAIIMEGNDVGFSFSSLDVSQLQAGTYILRIAQGNEYQEAKFLVK